MSHLEVFVQRLSAYLGVLLLLSANINSSEGALFDGCDHTYNINPGHSFLESPYYPNYYPPSTSCRYKFIAPLDYEIQVNCTLEMDKGASACSTEYFYLSREGDTDLRGSEQLCGTGTFVRNSLFRSIVLAYVSYGSWGRFRCEMYAKPQACDCGWAVNTKIVNGQTAMPNEFPSMAALKDRTNNLRSYCGATIIAHRFLLTAAHCTRRQPVAANIVALVGRHDLSTNVDSMYGGAYDIMQIIEHPRYTQDPVTNDIALLKTVLPIEWSHGVGPICLPPPSSVNNDFSYNYVDVIGWGTTSFAGPVANMLQKVSLMVIKNTDCQRIYMMEAPIYNSQMCTYDYTGNSRDSCQYDSGGPVILRTPRHFLLGCISFGKICGEGRYATGVNTRITSYLDWIDHHTSYTTCKVNM